MKTTIGYELLAVHSMLLANEIKKISLENVELVCISRGGLFVGGLLSYLLNIKKVHTVCLESYGEDNSNQGKEVISLTPFLPGLLDKSKTYLFVDDVNDTSKTFQYIRQQAEILQFNMKFAVIYHKTRDNNLQPDFKAKDVPSDAWLEFPWDITKQEYEQRDFSFDRWKKMTKERVHSLAQQEEGFDISAGLPLTFASPLLKNKD